MRGLLLLILSAFAGCQPALPVTQDYKFVELGKADTVYTSIVMDEGTLKIGAGEKGLFEAGFIYNIPFKHAEVNYEEEENKGALIVREIWVPTVGQFPKNNHPNDWRMSLNRSVGLEVDLKLGQVQAELDFKQLNLKRLVLSSNESNVAIDLSGDYKQSFYTRIAAKAGTVTIQLPEESGIKVTDNRTNGTIKAGSLNKNDTEYTNAAFDSGKVNIIFEIFEGDGEIEFR